MKTYKDMVLEARERGVASELTMKQSIEDVSELLEKIKTYHEEEYMQFMRKTHERLYGCHYDESTAKEDVKWMWHMDENGQKCSGEHWSKDNVVAMWYDKEFPSGTTDWDKYVAANIGWHDFSKVFNEEECLKIAYQFFFCDDDAEDGKVWTYVGGM